VRWYDIGILAHQPYNPNMACIDFFYFYEEATKKPSNGGESLKSMLGGN